VSEVLVLGDFNAKVGRGYPGDKVVGQYGRGIPNPRGDRLVEFCEETGYRIMNSFFRKKNSRKWTWISLNMETRNTIDYILARRPSIVKNVDVVTGLKFASDHRMVRARPTPPK
jgi:endonuclease/exonuclease/phosphatase family metal-dependent hydrolase